jgi:hypothetical protein
LGNLTKNKTVHTSRTMMFSELEKVMDHSSDADNFLEALDLNVTGKKSSSGVEKTANYLKRLYGFDLKHHPFVALKYFWKIAEPADKPLLAFIYAINHDNLLAESIEVLQNVKPGEKTTIELFEEEIEKYHPNKYSVNTRRSMAQNLASSWKQAGFIEGKVKNIRVEPAINYRVACFAFLLAYLKGKRGDFIWNSLGVNALCLYESKLRELAIECARKDLIQYQYAGSVTAIGFNNLLNKIGINANAN